MQVRKTVASSELHRDKWSRLWRMKGVNRRKEAHRDHYFDSKHSKLEATYEVGKACALVVLSLLVLIARGRAQTISHASQESTAAVRPFKIHVPDSTLADLHRRLAETKWPDQLPGTSWEYGADIKMVREVADYWQKTFSWREQEARINQF